MEKCLSPELKLLLIDKERKEVRDMAKNNCVYKVVVYIGGMESHDRKVIYTNSKQSKAEEYLHDYCKQHNEVCKAYIERSYGREALRKQKRRFDDEE